MKQWGVREVDVVIVTAIRLELDAVLQVDAGAMPGSTWEQRRAPSGWPVAFRSFSAPDRRALRIAVACAADMGATALVNTLVPLVEWLRPRCIAMCGVCAGRRGKIHLGDVVVADRVYYHDTGKQLPDQTQLDLTVYKLRDDWKAELESMDPVARFRDEPWFRARPLTREWREHRALVALRDGVSDPWNAVDPALEAGAWKGIVEGLCAHALLALTGPALTDAGHRLVKDLLFKHQGVLPDLSPAGALQPFRLHVAPIGSGARVIEDERIWTFVSQAMRKTLGIEMEAAAVAEVAHRQRHHQLDWVVMKGVMDFADHGRDDHFKQFAARASAECLLWFLRERAPTEARQLPCPYPGMRPYSANNAAHFHGREKEIEELLGRLRAGEREILVIGPSGCGKSSLVAAGVLPRLARGTAGLGAFLVRDMRPGEQPAQRLGHTLDVPPGESLIAPDRIAALLAQREPGSALLIVVDQLEELFTLADGRERELFLDGLRALRTESRCVVIFALRADFFGALMESRLWGEHRGQLSRIEVSPLRGEALREAISAPAGDVGVIVEPELIERLLADAASEPGTLPLLQETMVQLWDKRVDQTLTLANYQALGDGDRSGLAVALARRADATLRRLTPSQTAIARRIFLRLISFGEGRSDTRRQQRRSKLRAVAEDNADFEHVLRTLINDRLLTIDEDDDGGEPPVDLGHEIMIAAWPKLAEWIRTHRTDEQRRRQFEAAAALWVEHGSSARGLLDPIELAEAVQWQQTESALQVGQSAEVMEFIAASMTVHAKQRRRRRGLLYVAFAVLTGFVAVVITLALVARQQANHAQAAEAAERMRRAQALEEQGRRDLLAGFPNRALASLGEAYRIGANRPSTRYLLGQAMRVVDANILTVPWWSWQPGTAPQSVNYETGNPLQIGEETTDQEGRFLGQCTLSISADGQRVLFGNDTLYIWDLRTGLVAAATDDPQALQPLQPVPLRKPATDALHDVRCGAIDRERAVRAVCDGQSIHLYSIHDEAEWPIGVIDTVAGIDGLAMAGGKLVVAELTGYLRVYDLAILVPRIAVARDQTITTARFCGAARVLVQTGHQVYDILNVDNGRPSFSLGDKGAPPTEVTCSDDGRRIFGVVAGQRVQIWSGIDGRTLGTLDSTEMPGPINDLRANHDGSRLLATSAEKQIFLWDVDLRRPILVIHEFEAPMAHFSIDGGVILGPSDADLRKWDAKTGIRIGKLELSGASAGAKVGPEGKQVAIADMSGEYRLVDFSSGRSFFLDSRLVLPVRHSFSKDGSLLAATVNSSATGIATLIWDTGTGAKIAALSGRLGGIFGIGAFTADAQRVLVEVGSRVLVVDVSTGRELSTLVGTIDSTNRAQFAPDGARLLAQVTGEALEIWSALEERRLPAQVSAILASKLPFELRDGIVTPRSLAASK